MLSHRLLAATLLASLVAQVRTHAQAQTYVAVPLDGQAQVLGAMPLAISTTGQVVGSGQFIGEAENQPLSWVNAAPHALPMLAGDGAGRGRALDSHGTIVGESSVQDASGTGASHAVRWTGGQVFPLAGDVTAGAGLDLESAADLNEAGQITGHGRKIGDDRTHGWVLDHGLLVDLGSLDTHGSSTVPQALDAAGRVVGASVAADGFEHAFSWKAGVMTDLHATGHVPGPSSHAHDLNEAGVVCGSAAFPSLFPSQEFATLWQPDGTATNLGFIDQPGEFDGPDASVALGINDLGDVVGISQDYGHGEIAFLWRAGTMFDLTALVVRPEPDFVLLGATDIDDAGRITAFGGSGVVRAVLLVPDGAGTFTAYGVGTAGSGGFVPLLAGLGQPEPGQPIGLAVSGGLGGSSGLLLFGSSDLSLPFKPGIALQIAPLISLALPLVLGGTGPGNGHLLLPSSLPAGTPALDLFLQAGFHDPGVTGKVALTNPLQMHVE